MKPFAAFLNHLTGSPNGSKPAQTATPSQGSGSAFAAKLNGAGSNPNGEANKQPEGDKTNQPAAMTPAEKELLEITELRTALIMKNMGKLPDRIPIQDYDD